MLLNIPCKWKVIDLNKTRSPITFGEALRNYCFVGNCNDKGCYTTFKVLDIFKKIESGPIYEECKKYLYEDIEPTVYHYKLDEKDCYIVRKGRFIKIADPEEIVIGWTWDSDGCLYFRYNDKKVVNPDCKCSDYWEWEK